VAYLPNALNAAILGGKKKISKSSFAIEEIISTFSKQSHATFPLREKSYEDFAYTHTITKSNSF
jgi:hypothetical protein